LTSTRLATDLCGRSVPAAETRQQFGELSEAMLARAATAPTADGEGRQ
jgi:hypothetical protein